jgi:acetyl coenzyme A synthetase (ADP forming)-like protein
VASGEGTAEVALGVDPAFRGLGLATGLVERLALDAVHRGLVRFSTPAGPGSEALLDVVRSAGFPPVGSGPAGSLCFDLARLPEEREASEVRERIATAASLRPFFHPRAVAVVGASRDERSLGYRTLSGLVANRFQGPVYAVNPNTPSVGPFPSFPSVASLPGPVDLAVVLVPASAVPSVVEDCAAAGVRALVVITAGYAETGPEGRRRQEALLQQVRGHGMRMVGPNCMGLVNADPAVRLSASFAPVFPPAGPVAMSSQSGALGLAILAAAEDLGLGLSTFVSVGNKADVSGNDLLQWWETDEATRVILLYVESFGNPRRFARIARRVARQKPIVAVKSGRSGAGKRAAGSHTAALAGSDAAADALFRQTGVIRAETLEEMFDVALLASSQPLPRGNRVAILTNAGGPAILCADACEARGLSIPELPAGVRSALAAFLPREASVVNPVDMIASAGPEAYREAARVLLAAEGVDALVVIYAPIEASDLGPVEAALHEAIDAAGRDKPVVAVLMGEGGRAPSRGLRRGIPCHAFPESAARALATLAAYAAWRRRPLEAPASFPDADAVAARETCRRALAARGAGWLTSAEVEEVLRALGMPVVGGGVVRTAAEAVAEARAIGFPVALKVSSTTVVHKTDVGGVELDVEDEAGVRAAFARIQARLAAAGLEDELEGVLVQPMLGDAIEVMAGMTEDPVFGPLVAFGLGGVQVEILNDVVFRVTPLTPTDAREMVEGIRGRRLLQGYRGRPPADEAAIQDLLLRVAFLAESVPEVDDLDLNPVFALPPGQGCRVVDARIHVSPR